MAFPGSAGSVRRRTKGQESEVGAGGLELGPGVRWEEGPGGPEANLHLLFPAASTLWSP